MELRKGQYRTRLASTDRDVAVALALRGRCFRSGGGDWDPLDDLCLHILVEHVVTRNLACTFRILPIEKGVEIEKSYAAQSYNLAGLAAYPGKMLEVGRFCVDPLEFDPDIMRLAWGALTRFVDDRGIDLLFGCSSFAGTVAAPYEHSFAVLAEKHLAPSQWCPLVKAAEIIPLLSARFGAANHREGIRTMPALLKTYLGMGGWVSDHAVVDRDLNTMHVFTGVEIASIPPARARALRTVAL